MACESIQPYFSEYIDKVDSYYTKEEADEIYSYLETLEYEKTSYYMFGNVSHSPRKMKWFSDDIKKPYVFSRTHIEGLKPVPFTAKLKEIKEKIEETTGQKFNALLINKYESGEDKISWHSDNDRWCGEKFLVPSLSFGVERKFNMRYKKDKSKKMKIGLKHGSLIIMKEDCQDVLEHSISSEKKVHGVRYNLTFRNIIYPEKAQKVVHKWEKIESESNKRMKTSSKLYRDFNF